MKSSTFYKFIPFASGCCCDVWQKFDILGIPESTLQRSKVWRSHAALMELEAQTLFRNFDTKNYALLSVLLNQHIKVYWKVQKWQDNTGIIGWVSVYIYFFFAYKRNRKLIIFMYCGCFCAPYRKLFKAFIYLYQSTRGSTNHVLRNSPHVNLMTLCMWPSTSPQYFV